MCQRGVPRAAVRSSINGTEIRVAAELETAWVGIDVGKAHHWVCVVDTNGKVLLSLKVANDETEIVALLTKTASLAGQVIWAVDIIGAPSALLLALLARAGQTVRYASGRIVAAMSAAYVGEGKTDAKDARVIAETARLRRDLAIIDTDTDLVRNLAVLTGHRADLIADRVRMINRLRDLMTSVFPSLERAFDYSSHKGALVLLTGYASPDRIRRVGQTRLAGWLRHRKVRDYASIAARAVDAAKAQSTVLPGQDLATTIVAELATSIVALDERLKDLDDQSSRPSTSIRRPRSSSPCPASGRSSAPHCWSVPATCAPSPASATSPQLPGWSRFPTIPAAEPATCTGRTDTAAPYGRCSTCRRKPA